MRLILGPCHYGLLGLTSRLCRKVLVELSDLLLQSVKFVQEFRRYRIRLGRTLSALESIREGCGIDTMRLHQVDKGTDLVRPRQSHLPLEQLVNRLAFLKTKPFDRVPVGSDRAVKLLVSGFELIHSLLHVGFTLNNGRLY